MSSSESDSDDDAALEREVQALRAQIAANATDYEAHLKLIAAQRKTGDLDGVRGAREAMAAVFPLTAGIWAPWLEDEARLAGTERERLGVLALYGRAVGDYLSVPLWLAFVEYAEEAYVVHGVSGGLEAVRAAYERALAEAGLHFALGSELWVRFRAFERRVAEASGGGDDRVLALFRKQLRLPMAGLVAVRVEFEQSAGGGEGEGGEAGGLGGDTALQRDHERALKGADARAPLENALIEEAFATQPTAAQLAPWLEYVQFEAEQKGDARSRAMAVYERALACWPLSLELWLGYIGFAEEGVGASACPAEKLAQIYGRAVRNISWSGALWCGYLRSLQQAGASDEVLQAAFTQAFGAQLGSPDDVAAIHLQRCSLLRERLSATAHAHGSSADIATAAATLGEAFEDAEEAAQGSPLGLCKLQRLWAAAAAVPRAMGGLGMPTKARELWDEMLKVAQPAQSQPAGPMYTVAMGWLESVEMERRQYVAVSSARLLGDDASGDDAVKAEYETRVRDLYKRALEAAGLDNPVAICESWLQWEREEGNLGCVHQAEKLVEAKYTALRAAYGTAQPAAAAAAAAEPAAAGKKRKADDAAGGQKEKRSRKETDPSVPKMDPNNLDHDEVARMRKAGNAAAGHADTGAGGRKQAAMQKKGKINHELSIFVKNCPFDIDDTALYMLFSEQIGPVTQAKLIIRKETGKSRGFGYVEFASADHVAVAVARQEQDEDPILIAGRKLSISRSNMSEAIQAEQKKKEEAASRKKKQEAAAANPGERPKPRLMGLPVSTMHSICSFCVVSPYTA